MSGTDTGKAQLDAEDSVALAAIDVLVGYLGKAWITPGCRSHPQIGCASCEMVELEQKLLMLAAEIRESADIPAHI